MEEVLRRLEQRLHLLENYSGSVPHGTGAPSNSTTPAKASGSASSGLPFGLRLEKLKESIEGTSRTLSSLESRMKSIEAQSQIRLSCVTLSIPGGKREGEEYLDNLRREISLGEGEGGAAELELWDPLIQQQRRGTLLALNAESLSVFKATAERVNAKTVQRCNADGQADGIFPSAILERNKKKNLIERQRQNVERLSQLMNRLNSVYVEADLLNTFCNSQLVAWDRAISLKKTNTAPLDADCP